MILYSIVVDTRYAAIGFAGQDYTRYFRHRLGLRFNPQFLEEPQGMVTFRPTDKDPMGDFAVGPAASFCVSEAVMEELARRYGQESEFIRCVIEGKPSDYYVWILNRFETLIEPTWRPRSWAYAKREETPWLPDRIRSVDDIVREERLRSRWYCVDKGESEPATFYNLISANRWTGLKFVEEWRDGPK